MEFVCSKTNRSLLMGIAIVAITICHINQFIGVYKGLDLGFANEFLYASAAVGVDIFFFFSLVGLGFSLEKNKIAKYYKNKELCNPNMSVLDYIFYYGYDFSHLGWEK